MASRLRRATALPLLLVFVVVPTGATAGEPIALGAVRQSLFGVCYTSDREAWMIGELGRIFHTTDGGTSWERQDAETKRPFLAIACVAPGHAWIAGKNGIMYRTRDGGATWTPVSTGSTRHVFGLAFANAERGHGVGDFGTMVHTEDGGATWTVQRVPEHVELPESALDMGVEPGDVNLYGISYGDADRVWTVGEFGTIMASQNGGLAWTQQKGPFESTLFGVYFADPRHGWAVGLDSVIITTDDGGVTWTPLTPPVRQRSFYDVRVVGRRGWIVGDTGTVLTSTDGGASWRQQPLPITLAANWLRSVFFDAAGRGLAVGADGLVLRIDGDAIGRIGRARKRS
jgi:photosystem II stability/assembly factor-like uncharacterized protein